MIPRCDHTTAIARLKAGAASLEVAREGGRTRYRLRLSDGSVLYVMKASEFWKVVDNAPLRIAFARSTPTHITVYKYDFGHKENEQ